MLLPTIASGSFFHVFLGIFVEGVSRRRLPSYNAALLQLQPSAAAAAAADGRKVLVGTILHRAQVFDLLVQLYLPTRLWLLPQYFEEFMANGAVTLGCSQEKVVGDKFRWNAAVLAINLLHALSLAIQHIRCCHTAYFSRFYEVEPTWVCKIGWEISRPKLMGLYPRYSTTDH